jgi:hypothetical protein
MSDRLVLKPARLAPDAGWHTDCMSLLRQEGGN